MNLHDIIKDSLLKYFYTFDQNDFVGVTTQCIYPTGTVVQVSVRAGNDSFVVSDEGGAIKEFYMSGGDVVNPEKLLSSALSMNGVTFYKGYITARPCSREELGIAIAMIANASKNAADWLFTHKKMKPTYNFKEMVSKYLKSTFQNQVRAEEIIGESNKKHKFDHVISMPNGRKLVLDTVLPDTNSINARFAANFDLKQARIENLDQKIVYNEKDNWKLSDLNLLQMSANLVKYSDLPKVLH